MTKGGKRIFYQNIFIFDANIVILLLLNNISYKSLGKKNK